MLKISLIRVEWNIMFSCIVHTLSIMAFKASALGASNVTSHAQIKYHENGYPYDILNPVYLNIQSNSVHTIFFLITVT